MPPSRRASHAYADKRYQTLLRCARRAIPSLSIGLVMALAVGAPTASASAPLDPEPPEQARALSPLSADSEPQAEGEGIQQEETAPGHYIVVLKPSVGRPGEVAGEQAARRGGRIGFVYRSAIKGYSVAGLSHNDVRALRDDPLVEYVEPDRRIQVSAQTIPTGIERIFAVGNKALDIDGEDDARVNADVAVIDGRIDYTHSDLNVVGRIDCVPPGGEGAPKCVADTGNVYAWHATHVAGIVGAIDNGYGVVGSAPGARLWSVRVFDDEGIGYTSWTNAAIDWVTEHAGQIEVANMSLGGAGASKSQNEAIEAAVEAGVVSVVAAGNQGESSEARHPANSPDAITVSALTDYDGKAGGKGAATCSNAGADDTAGTFSNWGKGVELAAPGVCIYSTDVGGGYSFATYGTSFATPYVSGAAAVAASKANPENRKDVEAVRQGLVDAGSLDWSDTSEDGKPEPALYLGQEPIVQPEVATGGWSSTDGRNATLTGAVNAHGVEAEYWFEYGPTDEYGLSEPVAPVQLGASAQYEPVSQAIGDLEPGSTYHYRLTAVIEGTESSGEDRVLTTPLMLDRDLVQQPEAESEWLEDVSCPESNSCMATASYYDGVNRMGVYRQEADQWSFDTLPEPEGSGALRALGVSCTSAGACTIVGRFREGEDLVPLAERWNGSKWSIQSISPPYAEAPYSVLSDVSCATATDCMAVGYERNSEGVYVNYAAQWKGGSWSNMSPPNPTGATQSILEDVSCTGATACKAVGWVNTGSGSKPVILGWNGSTWKLETPARTFGTLYGVSCTSTSFCVAVGGQLSAEIWDGSSWSSQTAEQPDGSEGGYLDGVSCTTSSYCVAAGALWKGPRTFALTEVRDGEAWQVEASPREAEENAFQSSVDCVPLYGCAAVGGAKDGTWEASIAGREDVITGATSGTQPGQATLHGSVNPGGLATTYKFEYGKTEAYGASVPVSGGEAGAGAEAVAVTQEAKELSPETLYHYRLTATNSKDTVHGPDLTFRSGTPAHHFVVSIGSSGSGSGQMDAPWGLDVDPGGNLWVADRNNNRVEKFDPNGKFLLMSGREVDKTTKANVCTAASGHTCGIGVLGSGNGQFAEPLDVAVTAAGDVWVTDGGNNRVQKLSAGGEYLAQFGSSGTGNGQFTEPWGIDIASNGDIWVADARYYRIEKFSSTGSFILKVTEFEGPRGLEVDEGDNVWVTERTSNHLQKVSPSGEKLSAFGATGGGNGEFEEPQAVDVEDSGDLLVTDRINDRVQQFTSTGEYLTHFGDSEVIEPRGITVAGEGITYVSNSWQDRVDEWQQYIPRAVTQGTAGVTSEGATLSGIVNPRGVSTQYRFDYGKTSAYGSQLKNEGAGSGTADLAESAEIGSLSPSTEYHYRIVATSSEGTVYGDDHTFTTSVGIPTALASMSTVEPFNGSAESKSNFSSKWSTLGWTGGTTPKGSDTLTGWRPVDSYSTVNGTSYNSTLSDKGSGLATVATMAANPNSASRYFSLWLDMPTPQGSKGGYELRLTDTSTNVYTVTLSKWASGTQTVLNTQTGYSLLNGNSVALVDQGGAVSAWADSGSGFAQILSASDSSFSGGNAGLEGSGNITRLTSFKAGSL